MTTSMSTFSNDPCCPSCGGTAYRVVNESIEGSTEFECLYDDCGVRWWPDSGVVMEPTPWEGA